MFPPKTKVLVIDDMSTIRRVIVKTIAELGLTNVTEADDGATALPLLKDALNAGMPFDLIISDWNMPKMKGLELLKVIRQDPFLANTPFLMVTAEAEMKQVMEAVQAGVDNYIVKPFTKKMIEDKLLIVHKKALARQAKAKTA